jgi:hypothetical protein
MPASLLIAGMARSYKSKIIADLTNYGISKHGR